MRARTIGFVVAFVTSCSTTLVAQQLLHDIPGVNSGDAFGTRIAAGGDLDGDGASELLVTTRAVDSGGATVWAVDVRSGRTGLSLRTHFASGTAFLGAACVFLGDVDGDAVADYVCDGPDLTAGTHDAWLFSGASGTLIRSYSLTVSLDQQYARVQRMGDLDGDGLADFAASDSGPAGGHVDLVSTGTSAVLRTLSSNNLYWGSDVAAIADQDADGLEDLAICDEVTSTAIGSVRVFSSATGLELFALKGQKGDRFGASVARMCDLDGDGVDEYMIGAIRAYGTAPLTGALYVYSGATRNTVVAWIPGEFTGGGFGTHCADAGDVNGDGVNDLAIGAPTVPTWTHSGPAYVVSGKTFGVLYRFDLPDTMSWPHEALAGTGDLDGDGLGELAIGDQEMDSTPPGNGRVRVFGGNDLHLLVTPHVAVANQLVTLSVREGTASQLVVTALVDVDGVPLFEVIDFAFFDAATKARTLSGNIPPALSGMAVTFLSFAQKSPRGARASATEVLTLQ